MATNRIKDPVTDTETTGHEWDGIRELDNPAPKWLMYTFYATIIWAIGYWVLYPAWPDLFGSGYTKGVLGYVQRVEIEEQIAAKRAELAEVPVWAGRAVFFLRPYLKPILTPDKP